MPSDVHIQHSAHLRQAQPKLTVHTSDSVLPEDISTNSQTIYKQRYKALREAGFDEDTANKYSSIYSSVNEVIDAILSQSLADHLVVERGHVSSLNNGFTKKPNEALLSNGQHHFNQIFSVDHDTSHSQFSPSAKEAFYSRDTVSSCANETNEKHLIADNNTSDLIGSHLKPQQVALTGQSNGHKEHLDEAFKDGSDFLQSTFCEHSEHELSETNQRLTELFGLNVFANSAHDLSQTDQLKPDKSIFESLKFLHTNEDLRSECHFMPSDDVKSSNAFSSNLLVTVLKDSLFDSDEVILEDEGVAEPNVVSTSPSASSSSGASSLLLDSSSSPSSFSSLSSSISTTPPNALNGFESSPAESGFDDALFGYSTKQLSNSLLNFKSKFDPFAGPEHIDCNDLTQQTVNRLTSLNGNTTHLGSIAENNALDAFDKGFIAFNQDPCLEEMRIFGANSPQQLNSNLAYDLPHKYQKGNSHSYQFSPPHLNEEEFAENGNNHQTMNAFADTFDKYLGQASNNILFNCKSEESGDLMSYLNGNQMQHSLLDYDPHSRSSELFGLSLDKQNKSTFETKTDLFGDFYYSPNKTSFAAFSEGPDSIFNLGSDPGMLCTNSQSPFTAEFLNQQRTFADIAASNVISSGPKSNGSDHSLGAIGDCKLTKSSPIGCSNQSLNSSNNYFALFGNGANGPSQNSPFFEANGHGMAKKSFCMPQNYRSSMSPMGHKFPTGQLANEQMNFGSQPIRSNLGMSTMLNSNGIANNSEMGGSLSCEGSSLNKPTNLMGYKGLWVCNISPEVTLAYLKRRFRRFGHFTGIQTFERRATNGSNIVFVHYDNPYSPVEAISCLHNYTGQDLCADQIEPLKLRFAPSMEQSRAGQLPTLEQARKMIERHGECFNWRLSSGCHRGIRCQLKHVPINKEIDSQPWVKALKKRPPNADL